MKELLLVGAGGAMGSLARYLLSITLVRESDKFPVGTFIVNIIGAFLLGCIYALAPQKEISLFIATGFIGAFTTFSTFMLETFKLNENGKRLLALLYLIISIALGLVGFLSGLYLFEKIT